MRASVLRKCHCRFHMTLFAKVCTIAAQVAGCCTAFAFCSAVVIFSAMDLKHRSHLITDGRDRAGARSMFKAIGFTSEDLSKPLIGVANTWIETMPCNFHLRRLSAKVKEGVRAAGGTPM